MTTTIDERERQARQRLYEAQQLKAERERLMNEPAEMEKRAQAELAAIRQEREYAAYQERVRVHRAAADANLAAGAKFKDAMRAAFEALDEAR